MAYTLNARPPIIRVVFNKATKRSFTKELKKGRLLDFEETKQQTRGERVLTAYYNARKEDIQPEHIVELNFAQQSVMIDGALLTGKIDKIVAHKDEWTVVDLKTGKGFNAWDEPKLTAYDEIKLHHYKNQLMMYKLLVEHSRDYREHNVTKGVLEFVEELHDNHILELTLQLDTKEAREKLDDFKDLAVAVYKKIVTLDFPDISNYPKTLEGITAFEKDLVLGKI